MKYFILLILILCPTMTFADPVLPEKYRHLKWHYDETENFEILSLEKEDTILLKSKIEGLKTWTLERWGLEDIHYNKKCMIICVNNGELFKEFFHRDDAEPRETSSDKKDIYAIWIKSQWIREKGKETPDPLWITESLPEKVGRISLLNYSKVNNLDFKAWALVGMPSLNANLLEKRNLLSNLQSNRKASWLLSLTMKDYESLNKEDRLKFKVDSTALVLMLRKEMGKRKFLDILFGNSIPTELDLQYDQYCQNLVLDLHQNKVPDSYLTWPFLRRKK